MVLLSRNHQPVRNYVYRKVGKLPPKLSDSCHLEQIKRAESDEPVIILPPSESDVDAYDPLLFYRPAITGALRGSTRPTSTGPATSLRSAC